jgi:hypothetical protein
VTTGRNNWGQLGAGSFDKTNHGGYLPAVVDVGTDKSVDSVGLGEDYTCATISNKKNKNSNELKCWGAHPHPRQLPKGGQRVDHAGLKRLTNWRIAPLRDPSHLDSAAATP